MADRLPIVLNTGSIEQLQPDDGLQLGDRPLVRPLFKDWAEMVNSLGTIPTGGSTTIDLEYGNVVTATTQGASTWIFDNPPASGRAGAFTLILTNGGAGTQTWPDGAKWPGGSLPALTPSGTDVLSFFTTDGGSSWMGILAMKNMR